MTIKQGSLDDVASDTEQKQSNGIMERTQLYAGSRELHNVFIRLLKQFIFLQRMWLGIIRYEP